MDITLKADHQFDKLGDSYLDETHENILISDECHESFLRLTVSDDSQGDGVYFIDKKDFIRAARVFENE